MFLERARRKKKQPNKNFTYSRYYRVNLAIGSEGAHGCAQGLSSLGLGLERVQMAYKSRVQVWRLKNSSKLKLNALVLKPN